MMSLRWPLSTPRPSPPHPLHPHFKPLVLIPSFLHQKSKFRVFNCASTPPNSDKSLPISLSKNNNNKNKSNSLQLNDDFEPFRGKSGSVSFRGITHQMLEESKLESAPFNEGTGSRLWILGPVSFIASLVLPQFFVANFIDAFITNELLAETVGALSSEAAFYIGLAVYLMVTDHVQKPYLQFSAKRWGLITGLKGYLSSAFFIMGFKVMAPLFILYITWPTIGPAAAVAVAPFLIGCLAQFVFELRLEARGSSSWPIVPIIFEVYRIYQLTKALHFVEKLVFSMKDVSVTPKVLERSGALLSMAVTFQALGVLCLWSLLTFLMRLFPSRPVADRY